MGTTLTSIKPPLLLSLSPRHPAFSAAEIAQMLEIDLFCGRKRAFRRRLTRALEAAWELGRENALSQKIDQTRRA